jgi:AcrR family transcriptional regulator
VKYDTARLLDAAAWLAAQSGPAAVTMSAVAAAAGAPNGSMYHRFAGRPALLAGTWLRAVEAFQAGYIAALDGPDPLDSAAAAARYVVEWSRDHLAYATVLSYGAADFGSAEWPPEARTRLDDDNRRALRAVRALGRRLGATDKVELERLTIAVLDVPYALVRRHLRAGGIPNHVADLAEQSARALLTARP